MIRGNALSACVHKTKIELRQRVVLVGREAIPLCGLRRVLLVAGASAATEPERKLRFGIALFSLCTCGLPIAGRGGAGLLDRRILFHDEDSTIRSGTQEPFQPPVPFHRIRPCATGEFADILRGT